MTWHYCRLTVVSERQQRAFSLVELAIVMAVVGTIFGAIWWNSKSTRENARINDAYNLVQTVQQNILTVMQGRTYTAPFAEITTSLISSGAIPSYAATSATTAAGPWNKSNFKVFSISASVFRVSFYALPSMQSCLGLLSQLTGCNAGQSGCPTAVYTAGAANTQAANAITATPPGWLVLTPTIENTLCSKNDYVGAGANSVEFDYSL